MLKIDTIQRELGSLSGVLMDRLSGALEDGIGEATSARLDEAGELAGRHATTVAELECARREKDKLRREVEECGAILNRSRAVMEFDPALLRDAIDVELAGASPLEAAKGAGHERAWRLPDLPASWARTLDWLRPPRARDESFWDWRKRPPQPVLSSRRPR